MILKKDMKMSDLLLPYVGHFLFLAPILLQQPPWARFFLYNQTFPPWTPPPTTSLSPLLLIQPNIPPDLVLLLQPPWARFSSNNQTSPWPPPLPPTLQESDECSGRAFIHETGVNIYANVEFYVRIFLRRICIYSSEPIHCNDLNLCL